MRNRSEKKNSLMSACHREVFIDHAGDLSSAKESVISLSLLLCQIDSLLELRIWVDLLQRGSDLRNTSKFGNRCHRIDCDVLRSSTDSTISTSLIQCIASEVWPEQEHASVFGAIPSRNVSESLGVGIAQALRVLICFNHLRKNWKQSEDDWERGTIQSCLLRWEVKQEKERELKRMRRNRDQKKVNLQLSFFDHILGIDRICKIISVI